MGVTAALARYAVGTAHVLVAPVPGWWTTRVAVERQVLARGWRLAPAPADADVLAVCGRPGPELARVVDRVWEQMPGPRGRVDVHDPADAADALDRAGADLLDTAHQRQDARRRPLTTAVRAAPGGPHGGHGGDGGIPLAAGGEDRDGLEMDVLHLALGPVLPYWPAGLVLRCALQGDVIVAAEATVLDGGARHDDDAPVGAYHCDLVAGLLALAGWDRGATAARRVRDALLDGHGAADDLARLRRWVDRSWLLRWSLRRLGPLGGAEVTRWGVPDRSRGDTHDRLRDLLDRAAGAADPSAGVPVAVLADLVTGLELAAARLVVAGLDLGTPDPAGRVGHG